MNVRTQRSKRYVRGNRNFGQWEIFVLNSVEGVFGRDCGFTIIRFEIFFSMGRRIHILLTTHISNCNKYILIDIYLLGVSEMGSLEEIDGLLLLG